MYDEMLYLDRLASMFSAQRLETAGKPEEKNEKPKTEELPKVSEAC